MESFTGKCFRETQVYYLISELNELCEAILTCVVYIKYIFFLILPLFVNDITWKTITKLLCHNGTSFLHTRIYRMHVVVH